MGEMSERELYGLAVAWARMVLGLERGWALEVVLTDGPNEDRHNDGSTLSRPTYLQANIELRHGLRGLLLAEVVLHELLHVQMAEYDLAVWDSAQALAGRLRDAYLTRLKDSKERLVTRLTRALLESVDLPDWAKEDEDGQGQQWTTVRSLAGGSN